MGSGYGTYDDYEVAQVTVEDLAQLRQRIIDNFAALPEIKAILAEDATVLKPFLESNPEIRSVLRQKVAHGFASKGLRLRPE